MALGSIVFIEPAPYDLLAIVMFIGLLVAGLRIPRSLQTGALLLGLFLTGNVIAALAAPDPLESLRSMSIRIYMVMTWMLLVSIIVMDPARMLRALWAGYLVAATIAVCWGILEYFGFIASEVWEGGLRSKGPFKDPNVYGPFLVPAAVYCLSSVTRGRGRDLLWLLPLLLFTFGVLLSFSRGAWLNFVFSMALFAAISFALTKSLRGRLQWFLAGLVIVGTMSAMLLGAVSVDVIGDRFQQRAVLAHEYDVGTGGRFDAQASALASIAQDPIGHGPGRSALEFGREPHNLYLHVFVEAGWLAGLSFLVFLVTSIVLLSRAVRTHWALRPQSVVAFASLCGVLFQSLFIDSTHWRHLWLLLAIAWALAITCRRSQFEATAPAFMSKTGDRAVPGSYSVDSSGMQRPGVLTSTR
jgi:O-antigen ligase